MRSAPDDRRWEWCSRAAIVVNQHFDQAGLPCVGDSDEGYQLWMLSARNTHLRHQGSVPTVILQYWLSREVTGDTEPFVALILFV